MAKLHFYFSAMNAGKTTTLLQSNHNYQERGMETILFIPAIDVRRAKGVISSRIGLTAHAYPFDENFDFFSFMQDEINKRDHKISCLLIDEAQFLTKDQVLHLTRIVDELKIPTLTYGLRTDFRGETFPGSQYLLAWAEELLEIKTVCHCGKKAIMNARVDANGNMATKGDQIEIGGNDRYIALCRAHYMKKQPYALKQTVDQPLKKVTS